MFTAQGRVVVAKPLSSSSAPATAEGGVSSLMSSRGLLLVDPISISKPKPKPNSKNPTMTDRRHHKVRVVRTLTVMKFKFTGAHPLRNPIPIRRLRLTFAPSSPSSFSSSSILTLIKTDTKITSTNRFPPPEAAVHVNVTHQDCVFDDDDFYAADDLSCFRGLVLDISYRPVNVVCWRRAICLEIMEKAVVLEYYDQTVNSPSSSFYIPAVLRVPHLLQVVKRRRIRNSLSRKCILYRDSYMCQYCSSSRDLTIDHVLPIARGGKWTWENLVTACVKCNSRKGQQTLEEANMKLVNIPKVPNDFDKLSIPMTTTTLNVLRIRKGTPREWRQYI